MSNIDCTVKKEIGNSVDFPRASFNGEYNGKISVYYSITGAGVKSALRCKTYDLKSGNTVNLAKCLKSGKEIKKEITSLFCKKQKIEGLEGNTDKSCRAGLRKDILCLTNNGVSISATNPKDFSYLSIELDQKDLKRLFTQDCGLY